MDNPYLLMCLFSLVVSLAVLSMAIIRRRAKGSLYFTYMNLAIFIYVLGSLFEAAGAEGIVYHQVARIQYLGISFISPMVLLFLMESCVTKIKVKRHILPLIAFPSCVVILIFIRPDIIIPIIENPDSVWRYIYLSYSYIMMFVSVGFAIYHCPKRDAIYNRQIKIIVVAIAVPLLGNLLTIFTDIFGVDVTPLCVSISGLLISYALLFGGLFQIVPLAREEIVENMRDGFILVDIAGKYIDANAAAKNLFPPLKTASISQPLSNVEGIPWSDDGWDEQILSMETDAGARYYRTSMDVVTHDGAVICQCITVYDITPVQELLNETKKLAEFDSLTGLMNRRTFFHRVREKCIEMERSGGEALVLMLDLDFFKKVNDTYGHPAGDEVLRAVSGTLLSRFRKTDMFARYGGRSSARFCLSQTNQTSSRSPRNAVKR